MGCHVKSPLDSKYTARTTQVARIIQPNCNLFVRSLKKLHQPLCNSSDCSPYHLPRSSLQRGAETHTEFWWGSQGEDELGKTDCEDGKWLELAQDRVQWRVLNLRVLLPDSTPGMRASLHARTSFPLRR
jgi:hypothetical protein